MRRRGVRGPVRWLVAGIWRRPGERSMRLRSVLPVSWGVSLSCCLSFVLWSVAMWGCTAVPDPPHVCAPGDDSRIVFAYETNDPHAVPVSSELGIAYLFVTADCRFFTRAPDARLGAWRPTRAGVLSDSLLDRLNGGLLELPWPSMVNDNELVPPAVYDAGYRSIRRGSRRHFCNDGCPALLPRVEDLIEGLETVGAPIDTPLRVSGNRGIDDSTGPAIELTLEGTYDFDAGTVVVSGPDAAALRAARDVANARPRFGDGWGIPVLTGGVGWTLWFREVLPIETPDGGLPPPLDP